MTDTLPYAARLSSTVEEACVATGLGKTKLYELIASGAIETSTVGTRRLVLVRSVLKLIDPTYNSTYKSPTVSDELGRTGAEARTQHSTSVQAANYGPRRLKANG